ncbi:conserved hypothetical protein [Histoplasma capsulatum H143]|uniref:Uncharacterized protein n=1 Tax=Ajellomyces capsulatus (strain H143) TaxID=544712 RepID=C6HKI8_AJECH|nr:conserved hypothetical protein [Histoplasma capsulatum H143]
MHPSAPDDDYDPYKYPEFYLPTITPAPDLINLPDPLIPEFRHKDREYKLLSHLWHVQLGQNQVRHHWNIQALHDFWRKCGPPTFDGRHYGWSPTWIVDALDSLKIDLGRLQRTAGRVMLKRARMRVQARQVLESVGIQVEDEEQVSEEEVKLAVELAREEVGDGDCAGDEEVMIKKLLKDSDTNRERNEARRARLGALKERGKRTMANRSKARLGCPESDAGDAGDAGDESPTHKPPRARTQPVTRPYHPDANDSETTKKVDSLSHFRQESEPKGHKEQKSSTVDFHSHLIHNPLTSSLPKGETADSALSMDMEIRVSEYEVDSGSDSELENWRGDRRG